MIKFKIFFGTHSGLDTNSADHKLNKWLENNPNIYILSWQYQQARMGDHSICVEYDIMPDTLLCNETEYNTLHCDETMKGEPKQDD